jgi:methyl-accepting chemotaxis protein
VNETKSKVEHLIVAAKQKVDTGTSTAKSCDDILTEIVQNVSEVNQMVSEIASASLEQAKGVQKSQIYGSDGSGDSTKCALFN